MVNINSDRMWNVTAARPRLNALVAEAQNGQISHIVAGGKIVAHLVPASTWILDDQLVLEFLMSAIINKEASWAAGDASQSSYGHFALQHAGDVLGRVLGWAWRTDPDKIYMRAVADYAAVLGATVGRHLTFAELRDGLAVCLGGGTMERSEIAAALQYTEIHWDEWAFPPG